MTKGNYLFVTILAVSIPVFCKPVPVETMFRSSQLFHVSMSLDGKYLAAMYLDKRDKLKLMTYNIDKAVLKKLKLADGLEIEDYWWVSNTHLTYNTISRSPYKDVTYYEDMLVIDRDLTENKIVIGTYPSYVIDGLLADPEHAVIQKYYQSNYSQLALLNLRKGRLRKKERIRSTILWVETDFTGAPSILSIYEKRSDGTPINKFRPSREQKWKELPTRNTDYALFCQTPFDNTKLYISTYDTKNTRGLYVYDAVNNTLGKQVFSDSLFDFEGSIYFFSNPFKPPEQSPLRGVIYNAVYPTSVWFDQTLKDMQQKIDTELPHCANLIIQADTGLTLFLVKSYSDKKPAEYYRYNGKTGTMKLLLKKRPWIKPEFMAETTPITFQTRDSLTLHGYLTKPRNKFEPYPTVLLLHGGPQARDYWGFDPEVQVLANRGYAVLQVNYRGSEGFGRSISKKYKYAFHQMYLDVIDATKYAIRQGIADPERIAVMGTSFGGYLSISCVSHEPDMYRCAISNAGVFDWRKHVRFKRNKYNNYAYDYYKSRLGGENSRAYLKKISVMEQAENIRVPVFLAGGADDWNVNITQSNKLANLLKRNGVEVTTFFKGGEGHGFYKEKTNVVYYKGVLNFLNKHLHGSKK